MSIASSGDDDGKTYNFVYSKITERSGPYFFIWNVSGSGQSYSFNVANTHLKPAVTTVKVKCLWKAETEGGGGGGRDVIEGSAFGEAEVINESPFWVEADKSQPYSGVGDPIGVRAFAGNRIAVNANWSVTDGSGTIQDSSPAHTVSVTSEESGETTVQGVYSDNRELYDLESLTFVAVLAIEADPKVVCLGGDVSYKITTQPEGFDFMFEYEPADTSELGIKEVIAICGDSSATTTVTVIKVEINGPGLTTEGLNSEAFSVTVIPTNIEPAAYQWAASWPDGVGHTPGVNFDDPEGQETTVIKAQWHAQPDSRWASSTGYQCIYEITASVMIEGIQCASEPYNWIVRVIGTGTVEPWPIWSGRHTIIIEQNQDDLWSVVGQGQFVRHDLNPVVHTPATSDFYNKVLAHENHHVKQFAEIEPWSNMWDVDQLYANVLSQLPGQDTKEQMEILVQQEIDQWNAHNSQQYTVNRHEMEWQAYQKEYEVDPRYLEVQEHEVP